MKEEGSWPVKVTDFSILSGGILLLKYLMGNLF